MMRRFGASLAVFAMVLALGFPLMPTAEAGPETVEVIRSSIVFSTNTGGQVVPIRSTDVSFASGAGLSASSGARRVKSVSVKKGDLVDEGAVLVELDGDDVDERVDGARQALSGAEGALRQAQEAARLQAEQAAKLAQAARQAAGQAESGQAKTKSTTSECVAKISAVAATAAGETAAVMAAPPPGLPPVPTYQQLLPYLTKTQAAISTAAACLGPVAQASGEAGGSAATAKLLEQQAASMRSGGSAAASAGSRVEAARKQLLQAKRAQKALAIHAPYSSVVTEVNVTEGSLLPAGVSAVSLRSRDLRVRAELVEGDLLAVRPGAAASVRISSAGVEVSTTVGALPLDPLRTVQGPSIYPVYLPLPEASSLRAGQSARIKITLPGRENVLVVPTSAVAGRSADTFVTVVSPKGDDVTRRVVAGVINENQTEIIEGLAEGEVVRRIAH